MRTAKQRRFRHAGLALLVAGALATVGAIASPEPIEAAQDPAGNNGTVKVDGDGDWARPNKPNDNDPHVDCEFDIAFYNFDKGEGDEFNATVTFEFKPPTTRPEPADQTILTDEVFIGEDAAGGGQDEDARETYDLRPYFAGVQPHEQQGYHVKLTVNAPGSQGDDTKYKVFWVQCATQPTTTTTTGPTTTTTTGPTTTTTTAPPTTTTTAPPEATTTTTVPAIVQGEEEERPTTTTIPTTPGAVQAGQVEGVGQAAPPPTLPRTGPRTGFLYTGLGLALTGLVFRGLGRKR
jgi:hypothetical protein